MNQTRQYISPLVASLSMAFLFLITSSVYAVEKTTFDPQWLETQFEELASEDEERIYASVKRLAERGHTEYYEFLIHLFNGAVFVSPDVSEHWGLVIGGDPITDDDLDEWIPLSSVYPEILPLKNEQGKPLLADTFDLVEVETDRHIRQLIQNYLTRCELTSSDSKKRKRAIISVGNSGDRSLLPLLKGLAQDEPTRVFSNLLNEAIHQLELNAEDPLARYLAVQYLNENHCVNSIYTLQLRVTPDAQGQTPETSPKVRDAIDETISSLGFRVKVAEFIQVLFSGLSLGSILILMAMGLAIIYGLVGVINMAHGEFMMIGAYTTFLVQCAFIKYISPESLDYFFLVSMPIAFLVAGFIGVIIEKIVIRHLYGRPLESLLATWGISLLLVQSSRKIFGDLTAVQTPDFLSGGIEILAPAVFPYNRLFIMLVTMLMAVAIYILFYRSLIGTKIRAVTQNRDMSECLGIHTRRIDTFAFFIGTGIAGLAGCCLTLIGNVVPNMGQTYIVDSFLVVVTGGVGKIAGTFISGLSIGFCNKLLEPLFEAVYAKVAILALVILFLQMKPTGLFPAKGRTEDE